MTQPFFWHRNGKVQGLICCHVDDFFWGGTNSFEKTVIQRLKESFVTSQEELESFKYLGLNIVQKNDCIYLDQKLYIEELKELAVDTKRKMSKEAQLTAGEAWQLRGLAGQLNWTSSQTCPDLSFGACEISTSIKHATISDLIHANKNTRRLKAEQIAPQFPNLGSIECIVVCYSDDSFANLRSASSQGGYIMFLYKDEERFAQISWKSEKIQRVLKSTSAEETLALVEALEAYFMIRAILLEIYKKELHRKNIFNPLLYRQ